MIRIQADRDLIALALAKLVVERPGWRMAIIDGVAVRENMKASVLEHIKIITNGFGEELHPELREVIK